MKIRIVGGGPAGLYFACLLKAQAPEHNIEVIERNRAGVTFGFGVVFSDETLESFLGADPSSHAAIRDHFVHWTAIDTTFAGETIRADGHGFSGLSRAQLLQILHTRAVELGVNVRHDTELSPREALAGVDLLVGADGVNSQVRRAWAQELRPTVSKCRNRFIWLGTSRELDAFRFIIRQSEHGPFIAHAYPYARNASTFIVETDPLTFERCGLAAMSEADSVAFCAELFAEDLGGAPLRGNRSAWRSFLRVELEHWTRERVALLGDAAHTAHFSIGSGTKMAMEDAIALARAVATHGNDLTRAFAAYEAARRIDVAKLQRAAKTSRTWFENIRRHCSLAPMQLTTSLLTRSKRVTHDNLRTRDRAFTRASDAWFARSAGLAGESPPPPMFVPMSLRELKLHNRVVVSPMCQYMATNGLPNDWHLMHLGSRAAGGAGLVMSEMTCVSEHARITPGCTGLYGDAHTQAWRRITDFVHTHTQAKIGIQLGHAGRKGSTKPQWEGMDEPLESGNWPLLSASALPYSAGSQVPRAMDREDMTRVRQQFVAAAQRANEAGFDLLELHLAHGYLLASFISPLTNTRTDAYGGALGARMRYPLEVFDAVRAVWPPHKPMFARISACDWVPGGLTESDVVALAVLLREHGCDLIDVSTGQTTPQQQPDYGRMYQTPFAELIRHEAGIPTMAVGAILGWDHANTILAAGRADLCALARPHLRDPHLTLQAAREQGYEGPGAPWPAPYQSGK